MEDTHPTDPSRSKRTSGIVGGVIGSLGLAASIVALSATAGAASPTLQADPTPAPTVEDVTETVENDEAFAAAEACWADIEATFSFESNVEVDAIDWDAVDAEAEKCDALLPQEVQDQIAADEEAWAPYDDCIDAVFEEQGIDLDGPSSFVIAGDVDDDFDGELALEFADADFGPAVSIIDGEEMSFAEFGDGDGTITITKTGDDISVSSDGDVVVETFDMADEAIMLDGEILDGEAFEDDMFLDAELEEALSSCDDKLPEGIDLEDGFGVAVAVEPAELSEG